MVIIELCVFKVDDRSVGAAGTEKTLNGKIPIVAPEQTLPGWSEKMSKSILAGLKLSSSKNDIICSLTLLSFQTDLSSPEPKRYFEECS